jgi:hypothetical protein
MSRKRLVIINDFDIVSIAIHPAKAKSPLLVDADAMRALAVSPQAFQVVAWRTIQIAQNIRTVQLPQFSLRNSLDGAKPRDTLTAIQTFRIRTAEALNHMPNV